MDRFLEAGASGILNTSQASVVSASEAVSSVSGERAANGVSERDGAMRARRQPTLRDQSRGSLERGAEAAMRQDHSQL
jgi:hypothetical protein